MRLRLVSFLSFTGALVALVPACSSPSNSCALGACGGAWEGGVAGNGGASGSGGTAGADGGGGASGSGGTAGTGGAAGSDAGKCDATKGPADASCVIDEQYGVFVSPNGNDSTGDGSRTNPYATIAKALTAAEAAGKRVYACADGGSYTETLSIDSSLDGEKLYGGFKCSDWSYDSSLKATVKSADPVAAKVSGLTKGLDIEDFEIDAADAATAGDSSMAMQVDNSQNVVLKHVKLVAGKGAKGSDGAPYSSAAGTGATGNGGKDACTANPNPGGVPAETQCGGSPSGSIGGRGGAGADGTILFSGGSGSPGEPTASTGGEAGIGQTGATLNCGVGTGKGGGNSGNPGSAGNPGAGAAQLGTLDATGYTPADGAAGKPGGPGQGGGGGGGAKAPTTCSNGTTPATGASGGSGGGGGCGGAAGHKGTGGGASIALASVSSTVTLDSCDLVAQDGGKGGSGGDGQQGGNGGTAGSGGTGKSSSNACRGGDGGQGGFGGPGGGGSGGPSVAIAYTGTQPTVTGGTMTEAQTAAPGGSGGTDVGTGSNAGKDGLLKDMQGF